MNSRRSWLIFAAGALAYLVSVSQRSSLGVASVDAGERFHSAASALSTLGVLQLVVYAGLQIPVGVLIDRIGPKTLLLSGAALMVIGQLIVGVSTTLPLAIVGRVLVGAGDAATFISVLRLINTWFSGTRVPVLSQWMGALGAFGQILSAIPFAIVLHAQGWEPAFFSAAGLSAFAFVVVLILISDGAGVAPGAERVASIRASITQLGESLRRPGTQLGFWAHFVTQSSGVVFALFWGFPFMVSGLGLAPALASALLALMVVVGVIVGPILGVLTVRHPMRRSNLVLGIVLLMAIAWTLVLVWPAPVPIPLVVLLVVCISIGGPASQIGFDYARTFNPPRRLGAANGIVNVGGFTASFSMMFLIGVLLDLQNVGGDPADLYRLDAFRIALLIQYPVIGFGVIMLIRARRHTRGLLAEEEGIYVGPLWVALNRAWGPTRRRLERKARNTDS
ncbi:MFS transporter [Naasia lichenicola]|uniref:MFS transporter n=1 Tax=Naasia lichenicola TaxID=2565933 RepID=A0A4S4FSR6_9MICO|nr:MFS transporter [Naasia lichenicola]THG32952.1 MFS transporter [Naasia lichenicola]